MSRIVLKAADFLVKGIVVLFLVITGVYSVYALWDNNQIYTAAENVQEDMLKLKPSVEEDGSASFEELLAINEDVCSWVTLDNTNIDYPVVQGESNLTYLNMDVYGEFALAGSIFLDTRNSNDFTDMYSLLYGHHMENSKMFGDLDLYKDETFFNENTTGTLILPDRAYNLEIFACLVVEAGDDNIFDPTLWQTDISGLVSYVRSNSLYVHEDTITALEQSGNPQVLAFSTCSSDFTDARTIVLAAMN